VQKSVPPPQSTVQSEPSLHFGEQLPPPEHVIVQVAFAAHSQSGGHDNVPDLPPPPPPSERLAASALLVPASAG
jgi:hypothetical protein